MKLIHIFIFLSALILFFAYHNARSYWYPYYVKMAGAKTVDEVILDIGPDHEKELSQAFGQAGMIYPPDSIALIVIKDTDLMELWAHQGEKSKLIKTYPIKAASGVLGPKLREGDLQVPEGIYNINAFNPNSSYHLSLKLNYPNAFDLKYAQIEGRTEPGSNIFIHGKAVSVGCLAMGDAAIEELFTLVHRVGRPNVKVVITPTDPDLKPLKVPEGSADWVKLLYQNIEAAVNSIRN
jgi:murein L,D-transpeptidase YafK